MIQQLDSLLGTWTAEDLVDRFGAIPLWRVRENPVPGEATEDDVIEIHDRENRLCELVDGVLLEKTVGTYESYLAVEIVQLIAQFVKKEKLGIVLGADGMMRFAPGLIRIPDASFISWDRLPDLKEKRIADVVPDLAVEVISDCNTPKEMNRKLTEYFEKGVELVWYVYPQSQEVHVYTTRDQFHVIKHGEMLDGGSVLAGFEINTKDLFTVPEKDKD